MTAATSPERRGLIARAGTRVLSVPRAIALGWVGGLLTVPGSVARDVGANIGQAVAIAVTLPPRRAALFLVAGCAAASVPVLIVLAACGVDWAMTVAVVLAPLVSGTVAFVALNRGARRRAGSWLAVAREPFRRCNDLRAAFAATVQRSTPSSRKDHVP